MQRIQERFVARDLEKKIVIIAGPRQVGKTTLARQVVQRWPNIEYLNYDSEKDRLHILREEWNRKAQVVILDEIHKMKRWKTRIKGVYDTEGIPPRLLITGSAQLDLLRKGGDSLAGRFFAHRLYPFSIRELGDSTSAQERMEHLLRFGGFPEPFLSKSDDDASRWRRSHLDRIVRGDLQDLQQIRDHRGLTLLIDLLRERVGSTISYANLARDIEVSPHTVKAWIHLLELLYVVFMVRPFHKRLTRAILKEPKIYFFDTGSLNDDPGARFENFVALSLRKWTHFLEDTRGSEMELSFLRDKEKREVDFVITEKGKPLHLIEAKWADDHPSASLHYYHSRLRPTSSLQLVGVLRKKKTVGGVDLLPAAEWLSKLDI